MKICIYGLGGMGKVFKDFFQRRGYLVKGFDVKPEKREVELERLNEFDVIFLCVPMEEIAKSLETIRNYTKDALIVDISSVKRPFLEIFERVGMKWMSIHPMFGPDSEVGFSSVIVTNFPDDVRAKKIIDEFKSAGVIVSFATPEEHDEMMAKIQGVTHFLLLGLASYLKDWLTEDRMRLATPIFATIVSLSSRILNQDWRLYKLIFENGAREREMFVEHLRNLNEILKEGDELERVFESLKKTYRYFENSSLILEASKLARKPDTLEELRGFIRTIDFLILRLLECRVEAGRSVALRKVEKNEPVEISEVEDEKIRELTEKTELDPEFVGKIFGEIMNLTKVEEYRVAGIKRRIAVLGPAGSFSEEAALKLTASRLPLVYCSNVEEVVKAVECGKVDYGVIPIENSVNGTVIASLDALLRHDVEVFGELELEVRLNLVAKRKMSLKDVKVVFSHPQAISQCSNFIANYLPHAEIRYTRSTSDAVSMLDDSSAAITSDVAARIYGLHVIRRDIQDSGNNVTRFYVIRKRGGEKRGNVTALFFGVEDRPGALFDVLEVFKRRNINLRKLESRPSGVKLGDYVFFVEAEKKLNDEELSEVRERTTFCKVVGVFEKIDRLDVTT